MEKTVSESSPTPAPPKALPKSSRSTSFGFWHGFGLHALMTIGLLVLFWIFLPRLFPGINQSPLHWTSLEKKLQELEVSLTQLKGTPGPDLSQIQLDIDHLTDKVKSLPSGSVSPLPERSLIQLSYLLRLDHALTTGQGYEYLLTQLKSDLSLKENDFPHLFDQQNIGFETLSSLLNQSQKDLRSTHVVENVALPDHIWAQPLSKFIKVRKHIHKSEANNSLHEILTLLHQNKLQEALEKVQQMAAHDTSEWVKDLEILIQGRQELEKLWHLWESQLSNKTTEEKNS